MSNEFGLNQFFEFLRFPSISTDPGHDGDMRACASWLAALCAGLGMESRVVETGGHPAVVAGTPRDPALRTVLVYGHYDVQPVDPVGLWSSPPFEPTLREGRVFARGASDNKGQILAHILGAGRLIETSGGRPPVNLVFLVEGEEEVGSPHLDSLLEQLRDELACDVVAVSDTGMLGAGIPTFTYGLRGIAALELVLRGPSHDLHSGIFGGAVANPATWAARLVAGLHNTDRRVAIPGFYDRVRDIESWERSAWAKLPLDDAQLLELTGAPAADGEADYTTVERIWARPTAEVNGIHSGYAGEGTKTVLPAVATVKLTFRLVPDQDPAEILLLATEHLRSQCPLSITLDIRCGHAGSPYLVDPDSVFGRAACRALETTFGAPVQKIREGGSIPIVQSFRRVLGADTLLLGLALPDANAHAPDESFPLENFRAGMDLHGHLMREIADSTS